MSWALQPGEVFAGYRIESVLGRGGMGVVYRAEDLHLGRTVALKVLAPERANDPGFRDRFLRESKLLASIDHRNIVDVFHADEVEDQLFLVMRFIDGFDLGALLAREGRLEARVVAHVIREAAEALDEAHSHGLVHRDVKPGNVLIAPRGKPLHEARVYLSDFGLTKRADGQSQLTTAGQFLGTPAYVAPEQIQGSSVDGRADLYALACVAYECLTGSPPYHEAGEAAVLMAHLIAPPPDLIAARPDLPAEAAAAVARGMAKSRDQRPDTCVAFAASLQSALGWPDLRDSRGPVAAPSPPAGAPPPPVPVPAPVAPAPTIAADATTRRPVAPAEPEVAAAETAAGETAAPEPPDRTVVVPSAGAGSTTPAAEATVIASSAERIEAGAPATPPPAAPPPPTARAADLPPAPVPPRAAEPPPEGMPGRPPALAASFQPAATAPARPAQSRGRNSLVVLGAAVVLVVALVGMGAFVFARLGSPGATGSPAASLVAVESQVPTGSPSTPDPARAFPDAAESRLLAMVPQLVRTTCQRSPDREGDLASAVAVIDCQPQGHLAPDDVRYAMYDSESSVEAAYGEWLAAAQTVTTLRNEPTRCTTPPHEGGYGEYTHGSAPGRVICYVDGGGRAVFAWSVKVLRVMSQAIREDGNSLQLYEWWSQPERSGPNG